MYRPHQPGAKLWHPTSESCKEFQTMIEICMQQIVRLELFKHIMCFSTPTNWDVVWNGVG